MRYNFQDKFTDEVGTKYRKVHYANRYNKFFLCTIPDVQLHISEKIAIETPAYILRFSKEVSGSIRYIVVYDFSALCAQYLIDLIGLFQFR